MAASPTRPGQTPPPPGPAGDGTDDAGGRRTTLIILVLAFTGTLVSLQQTLVLPLLPEFPTILDTTPDNASWLVTVTLLTAAVGTPIISRLADMFGKRRMMIVCLVAVVLGSLLASITASLPLLILGRGLAGIGACLVPVGISIMRDTLPADRVGGGVALMSATLGIGGAVGMPLAGVIFENLDWHALFWVSGAFAVLMLVLVVTIVPESSIKTSGRFDYGGALLLSAALTAFLLAVSKGGTWGWSDERIVLLFLGSAVAFAAWVPYELRVGQPLVDIRTSTRRTVLLTNVASILIGFGMFANFLTSAQQVQPHPDSGYGFGLSPLETGLVLLPGGLLMIAMAPIAARLIRVIGPRNVLIMGPVITAAGFLLREVLVANLVLVVVAVGIASIGVSLSFAAMPTLIMRSVPITETASANGLNTLVRSIGTSSASALVTAIFATLVVTVEGEVIPSFSAYQLVFWLGAATSLAGAGIACFIRPLQSRTPAATGVGVQEAGEDEARYAVKAEDSPQEVIVRGTVVDDAGRTLRNAVVAVLRTDGRHLDWSRSDNEGRFALAVPQRDTYLIIASADGWGPQSQVVSLVEESLERITLTRRLTLSGKVADGPVPHPDAVVILVKHSGEYVARGVSGPDGAYSLALPPPGRYVVTALDRVAQSTTSRVVQVGSQSTTVDLDLEKVSPRVIPVPPGVTSPR